ncbi:glycosyltransferase [Nocardioides rotundus]|uniref:glycosyltransferase n=1 Tax=Nocardioides rotundus TaxID=1774216 RepID=UPI001CBB8CF1|nr:glycosyltransferase [Nocardioides rotundus]UAL28631.1 glycosyltransferase [Nocardioides rotundus]
MSEARVSESAPETTRGYRIVQHTLMRPDEDLDIRPLYVNGLSSFSGGDAPTKQMGREENQDTVKTETTPEGEQGISGFGRISSDGYAIAEPGKRLSFGAYFNAFPASYWRRWTDIESVRLTARLSGSGNLLIYRSTAKGHVMRADAVHIDSDGVQEVVLDLSLQPFIDGGWYWFDIEAENRELVLESAHWSVETDRMRMGTLTIGITTFNRPDFCAAQLKNLAETPAVLDVLDEVIVVDQGNQKVRDDESYPAAAAVLGDKLRIIDQDNLGGSGGFSRAMLEAEARGRSDYVLLLDDDVVCEMDGILRAITFADLCSRPTIVGGHMFSLYDRSVLHAYGETLERYTWFWGPAPSTVHGQDFSRKSLRRTQWLHRRVDVDYNGWWMCLIPTQTIREIGLALPMFIKWDDAEFGLRAGEAGYPTVTLPGAAVWHVPWTEKDDTLDWQAYFHERNRLISCLLHTPYERGGRMVMESWENHSMRMVAMQYSTGETILRALQDVLDGPERMHRDMATRLGEVRKMRDGYSDGHNESDLSAFPEPRRKKPPKRGKAMASPTTTVGKMLVGAVGLVRQVTKPRDLSRDYPEALVPHVDQRWWRLAQMDSAIVSTADGTSASFYRRDPEEFRAQMTRSAKLHAQLWRDWPELARRYRDALPELTSPEAWKRTFEGYE